MNVRWFLVPWFLVAPSAGAQGADTGDGACWRGRPLPACRSFVISEVAWLAKAHSTREIRSPLGDPRYSYEYVDFDSQLAWELGWMRNRDSLTALGATVMISVVSEGPIVGVKGRYRRWLGAGGALDIGAGPIVRHNSDPPGYGVTLDVALNASDYAAAVIRTDVLRADGRTQRGVFGGFRLGSKPAAVATAAIGVGFLFLVSAMAGSD